MTFRWVEIPGSHGGISPFTDPGIISGHSHAADLWRPWIGGPSAARAMVRRFRRIHRQQADREIRVLGYRDIGGEG